MSRARFLAWVASAVFVGVLIASASRPAAQTDSPYPSGEMTTERPMSLPSPDLARLAEAPPPAPPSAAAPAALPSPSAVPSLSQPRAATISEARTWARRQLGARQFACLDALVQRESRWNPLAVNRRSGAAGLFQALPPEKQAKYGADYLTNPMTQMRFGLAYIASRYGTACAAYRHALREGWF